MIEKLVCPRCLRLRFSPLHWFALAAGWCNKAWNQY
jgi:hypothetical protein